MSTRFCQSFPVLVGNHSAIILQKYSLAYSKPCQTSKMERFVKNIMGKNSSSIEILWFFDDFREG